MRQATLMILACLAVSWAVPAAAQTQRYETTQRSAAPKEYRGCATLAPGASAQAPGQLKKRAELPPRLRKADRVKLKNKRVLQARTGRTIDRAVSPSACPDTVTLRLSK